MNAGPIDKLTAANALVAQARKLVTSQEQEVARMQAARLDTARAQSLLDAYQVSLHLAQQELAEAEEFIEGAERPARPARRIR